VPLCPAYLACAVLMASLTTNESTADWKRLKHIGGGCLEDLTDSDNLWIRTLNDPEGHPVQLLQPSGEA
jgi:hypothetical protein